MSGMDRLSDDKLKRMAEGLFNALEMQLLDDLGSMARELLAHRRASQSAPAPSDGLRGALAVVSAVLQSEVNRSGGKPFSGTWHIPSIDWRGSVPDALDLADAALSASPAQEGAPLDVTTRVVLDRAERIVAGQSQQERRIAEIFLRPTENSHE